MIAGLGSVSCADSEGTANAGSVPAGFSADRCLVQVHGRSEQGAPPAMRDGYAVLRPDGNSANPTGDGRMWTYDSPESYDDALRRVTEVVDDAGCRRVVLHGFSNGGGLLGAVICRGETLQGRLAGAIVDDPVPDDSSPCMPDPSVAVVVYWTGGLEEATAGASCEDLGWVCAGSGVLVGIEEYARRLGTQVTPSIHTEHLVYSNAPEINEWLSAP